MSIMTSIKPPSVHVNQHVGPQLSSLGGTVHDDGISAVQVRFADPKNVALANSAFEGTLAGITTSYADSNGNGVRGYAGYSDVLTGIASIAGVTGVSALETFPAQIGVTAKTAADAAAIDMLLRPTVVPGEGHSVSVRVGDADSA